MKDTETTTPPVKSDTKQQDDKRGLFRRMFLKLDESMKRKADEKHREGNCCGPNDKGGGGCC